MRRRLVAALAAATLLAACGGEARELSGYRREPAPQVGAVTLPDLAAGGAPFPLRARPGGLLLVYFGYTNCPDACPTTLADTALAEQRLDADDPGAADRIDMAMITVDPARDLPVIADYLRGFHPDGHALGTDDPQALADAAAPFGASYQVVAAGEATTAGTAHDHATEPGEPTVAHSTELYAVDEGGTVVLTWPWPTPLGELTEDLRTLLAER